MIKVIELSIVIPVYNVEKHLSQCIQSIVDQNQENIEIILVDDGSFDNSPILCDDWAKKTSNIKVIHQYNQGLSIARNNGLAIANGNFVWFVDSDDYIVEGSLTYIFKVFSDIIDIDVITSPLYWSYDDKKKDFLDIIVDENICFSGKDYINKGFPTGAIQRNIIKKKMLDDISLKFYPKILHEDGLFGLQMFYQAKKVYLLKNNLYIYIQRQDSIMHNISMKNAYDIITIHQKLMEYMDTFVERDDVSWFRIKCLSLFDVALEFAWNLRKTNQFKLFWHNTALYRAEECKACFNQGSLKSRLMSYLYCYCPFLIRRLLFLFRSVKNVYKRFIC